MRSSVATEGRIPTNWFALRSSRYHQLRFVRSRSDCYSHPVENVLVRSHRSGRLVAVLRRVEAPLRDGLVVAALHPLDGGDGLGGGLRDDGDESVVDVGVQLGDGGDDAEVLEVRRNLCKHSRQWEADVGGVGEDERVWIVERVEGGTIPTNCSSTVSNATP
jgi:hypothetical protein